MKILLIEDDDQLAQNIKIFLEDAGFLVDHVRMGKQGTVKAELYPYSVIILDWMLPDGNGPDFLKQMREKHIETPVIIATARGQVGDRLEGFIQGADDYLVKPYNLAELVARITAIIRRNTHGTTSDTVTCGSLIVDFSACVVRHGNEIVSLTPKEFSIVELLAHHLGKVVLKGEIIHHVWHDDIDLFTNNLEVHIKNVRQKIDKKFGTEYLKTVKGKGYLLSV